MTVAAVVVLILAVVFAAVRAQGRAASPAACGRCWLDRDSCGAGVSGLSRRLGSELPPRAHGRTARLDRGAPSTEQVVTLGFDAIRRMNGLYEEAHRIGWEPDPRYDRALLDAYAFVQQKLGDASAAVPGRLKSSIYGPYFRWTTVDGMVDPFALEVLANPDLLPFERTFVAAHEWAHLAGFADESEANFVAWLTCIRAGAAAQYSGWLSLYWQIGSEVGCGRSSSLVGGGRGRPAPRRAGDQRSPAARPAAVSPERQLARLRPVPARQPRRRRDPELRQGDYAHSSGALRGRLGSGAPDRSRASQ